MSILSALLPVIQSISLTHVGPVPRFEMLTLSTLPLVSTPRMRLIYRKMLKRLKVLMLISTGALIVFGQRPIPRAVCFLDRAHPEGRLCSPQGSITDLCGAGIPL